MLARALRSDAFSTGKFVEYVIFAPQKCVLRTRGRALLAPTIRLLNKTDNQYRDL